MVPGKYNKVEIPPSNRYPFSSSLLIPTPHLTTPHLHYSSSSPLLIFTTPHLHLTISNMVFTRSTLDTSKIVPKKVVRRKNQRPTSPTRSISMDINNFLDGDITTVIVQSSKGSGAAISNGTVAQSPQDAQGLVEPNLGEDDIFRASIASKIDELLPPADENCSTQNTEKQIIDSSAKVLSRVNISQSTSIAGLVTPKSTVPSARPGSGAEIPCSFDEIDSGSDDSQDLPKARWPVKLQSSSSVEHGGGATELDESMSASGTGKTHCRALLAVLTFLDSNIAYLSSSSEDNSPKHSSSPKRKRQVGSHVTKSEKTTIVNSGKLSVIPTKEYLYADPFVIETGRPRRSLRTKDPVTYQFRLENFWIKTQKNALEELEELNRTLLTLDERENSELSQDNSENEERLKRRKIIEQQGGKIQKALEDIKSWDDEEQEISRRLEKLK
jgi:hypothetical protein